MPANLLHVCQHCNSTTFTDAWTPHMYKRHHARMAVSLRCSGTASRLLLTDAHVCSRMRAYAHGCARMLTDAR
eukprot:3070424-Rhodomonas_salina.2